MKNEKIIIDNLHCGGCVNSIQNAISKLKGIENVKVDLASNSVQLSYDDLDQLNLVYKKLSKMGYPKSGTSTNLQKAKSYVSCAIGRMSKN